MNSEKRPNLDQAGSVGLDLYYLKKKELLAMRKKLEKMEKRVKDIREWLQDRNVLGKEESDE